MGNYWITLRYLFRIRMVLILPWARRLSLSSIHPDSSRAIQTADRNELSERSQSEESYERRVDSRRKMSGMYSWHNYTSTSARQNTDPLLKNPSRLVRSGFVIFDLISKQNLDLRVDSERYRIALSNDMTLTVTRLGAFGTRFLTYIIWGHFAALSSVDLKSFWSIDWLLW